MIYGKRIQRVRRIRIRNPLETMALDAVIGALGGGAVSGAYGKGVQMVRGSRLRNFIISDKNLKELRKQENNYYKDYIQGTKTKRSDLGDISYTQAGLETVSKKPSAGRYFANLKKDIKTAKYIKEEQPSHIRNDDIIKFYRLEKGNKEFLIAETPSGKKYYMSSMKKL